MNKVIFLDRDGTINVDFGYVYKMEDFEFIDGVLTGLKLLQDAGYLLIIVTNQSGIARGYYTVEDFNKLTNWMILRLDEHGINISKVYYCPHLSDGNIEEFSIDCNCRKPKTELFEKAINEFDVDTKYSFVIGDKIRDLAICNTTEVTGILLTNNPDERVEICKPSLLEAAHYIIQTNLE